MTATETEVRLTFPERMEIALKRMGMKKGQAADYLGLVPSSVSRWMSGETVPPVATLRLIASQSGLPYEWLKPSPDDPDPASVVHPPGLEPGTHWLRAWDVVTAAEALLVEAVAP